MTKTINYFKFSLIYIFILILLLNFVSATTFDFYRNDGTAGTTFYVGYKGSSNNIPNHVVKNNNAICSIKCTFVTDQGKSGTVPGVSEGYIPAQQTSPRFSIPVVAEGDKILTTTMICEDEISAIWCSGTKSSPLSKDITLSWDYCGDGKINGPEICDGGSKDCSNINSKYYSGTMAGCKSDCSGYNDGSCKYCGDGVINGGEQCDGGSNNGKVCIASYGGTCTYCSNNCNTVSVKGPYCGDGNKDPQENCGNCYSDATCADGPDSCKNGVCIDLNTNENCGSIGNRCDTTPRFGREGGAYCSNDNRRAIQKGTRTWYECINKACNQQSSSEDDIKDCGDKLCQDDHCGCNEGYAPCLATGKCERQGSLKSNEACGCAFQCQSGYCSSQGKCMEGLNAVLSSSDKAIKPGEETSVTLSVDNPFDKEVDANIVVSLSGAQVSGVISGQACSGNQCKTAVKIPAKGKEDVSIMVQGTKEETINLMAKVTYSLDGNNIEINKQENIKVTSCGREDCTGFLNRIINRLQEIKLNIGKFSISGLTLGAIIIILVVIGFVLRIVLHRKHYHKEPIFKKSNKCLKCGAEIERDKSFCPECGEKISKGKKSITVCSKCGETLRSNVNYCHKCGGKAKKIRI